tara:strand:+ start:27 stop:188 length:162 start_codon:yes stop_codon:yes gene_type:complete
MYKYLVKLESGRDFVMNSNYLDSDPEDVVDLAYEAYEEAAYMDDYLIDVIKIE